MNIPKLFLPILCASSMLLAGCNNKTSEKNTVNSEEAVVEELGKALTHTNLSDIEPISMEDLEAWLPETLGGLPMTNSQHGSMSKMGVHGIAAMYGNPYEKSILLTLTDSAGKKAGTMGLAGSFRRANAMDIDSKTENGYQKTVVEKGVRAIEYYGKHDDSYLISIFHQDRFEVEVRSAGIPREEAWKALHSIPLDKLLK